MERVNAVDGRVTRTADSILEAELTTIQHHIAFYTQDERNLQAELAKVQEKLHGYQAEAVSLEDALTETVTA